jgi:hypothetical protein
LKCLINPITNPNSVYSHTQSRGTTYRIHIYLYTKYALCDCSCLLVRDGHLQKTQIYWCNSYISYTIVYYTTPHILYYVSLYFAKYHKTKNSVALVRKQTIPTKRPPLVVEVSANFCGEWVSRGQRNGSPRPLISGF